MHTPPNTCTSNRYRAVDLPPKRRENPALLALRRAKLEKLVTADPTKWTRQYREIVSLTTLNTVEVVPTVPYNPTGRTTYLLYDVPTTWEWETTYTGWRETFDRRNWHYDAEYKMMCRQCDDWVVDDRQCTLGAVVRPMFQFEGVPHMNLMTAAERAEYEAQERRVAEARRAHTERFDRMRGAADRAVRMLRRFLTAEQLAQYAQSKYFFVRGSLGGRYRIDYGAHGNVKRVDEQGAVLESLCVQPAGVPDGDAMLAQKLLLETNEQYVRDVANINVVHGERRFIPGSPQNMIQRLFGEVAA